MDSHIDSLATSIRADLATYAANDKKMFATCSFQSQSMPLLHILSTSGCNIPIYLTNTGFLFPETLAFAEDVCASLGLELIRLQSDVPKVRQRDSRGAFLYASDPDYCCFLNKVKPLEPILQANDVWINGIRADQSEERRAMRREQAGPFECLRYHPMLDWSAKMIHLYRKAFDLPSHPLEDQGYLSIGCEPCTTRYFDDGNERNSRWFGMNKTECGLHTVLVKDNP